MIKPNCIQWRGFSRNGKNLQYIIVKVKVKFLCSTN
jgi:hypothetical protein